LDVEEMLPTKNHITRNLQAELSSALREKNRTAVDIRDAIQRTENNMSWPPRPSDFAESAMNISKELRSFLQTLLTTKKRVAR